MSLTDGRWRPPTVALNKSPAWVLSGREPTTTGSSPRILIDFLLLSWVSLNRIPFCNGFEQDAGDPLAELSLSLTGYKPTRFSGFCKREWSIWHISVSDLICCNTNNNFWFLSTRLTWKWNQLIIIYFTSNPLLRSLKLFAENKE